MFPDPAGIDLLIPLGSGSQFKDMELRYCLRSLERHASGVRRVVIVGQKPRWLSNAATHVPAPQFQAPKDARIALKVVFAFENGGLGDEVLFANDDYVFLKNFDARTVPDYQGGQLSNWIPKEGGLTRYQHTVKETEVALKLAKLPTFYYDIHVPIRYRKDRFLALKPWWEMSRKNARGFVVKSVYANNQRKKIPGPKLVDFKMAKYNPDTFQFPDRWVMSYGDGPLYDSFENELHKRFPEKSRFEL